MKLVYRLAAVLVVPLICVLVLAGVRLSATLDNRTSGDQLHAGLVETSTLSALIHELQRERGMTAGFVASRGKKFAGELPEQRGETDKRMETARQALTVSKEIDPSVSAALRAFDGLSEMRERIDAQSILGGEATGYYTKLIESLTTVITKSVEKLEGVVQGISGRPLLSVINAKEMAGRERAVGAIGFSLGKFEGKVYRDFAELRSLQKVLVAQAKNGTAAAEWRVFEQVNASKEAIEVQRLREVAHSVAAGGQVGDVNVAMWFNAATAWVDQLKLLEDHLADRLLTATDQVISTADEDLMFEGAMIVFILLASITIPVLISRSLTRQFGTQLNHLRKIAGGNLDGEIVTSDGHDEISELARMAATFQGNEKARIETEKQVEEQRKERRAAEAAAEAAQREERERREKAEQDMAKREREREEAERAQAEKQRQEADERERQEVEKRMADERERAERDAANAREQEERADQLASVINALTGGLRALAEGRLGVLLEHPLPTEFEELRQDYNSATTRLHGAIGDILGKAGSIQSSVQALTESTDNLATRTEGQRGELDRTASAMTEMAESISATARTTAHADQVTVSARSSADQGEQIVSDAISAMVEIQGSSKKIADIINVIDDIAFQTNLLALNAGVEAARAGDAGRGFAVVASEVRALAQRCSDAAQEIKELISASGAHVDRGVDLVGQTGDALKKISDAVRELTDLSSSISTATNEQSAGVTEINQTVNNLDRVTQQNAAMVEETTAAYHELTADTRELFTLMRRFDIEPETESAAA